MIPDVPTKTGDVSQLGQDPVSTRTGLNYNKMKKRTEDKEPMQARVQRKHEMEGNDERN